MGGSFVSSRVQRKRCRRSSSSTDGSCRRLSSSAMRTTTSQRFASAARRAPSRAPSRPRSTARRSRTIPSLRDDRSRIYVHDRARRPKLLEPRSRLIAARSDPRAVSGPLQFPAPTLKLPTFVGSFVLCASRGSGRSLRWHSILPRTLCSAPGSSLGRRHQASESQHVEQGHLHLLPAPFGQQRLFKS
jgi:hypothetical protein